MSTQYHHLLLCVVLNILVLSAWQIAGKNTLPEGLILLGENDQVLNLVQEGGKPTGRFCNGRLVTNFLSQMLGIKNSIPAYLDPAFGIEDFATGVSFASAGTGYDDATSNLFAVIPLSKELEYFKEYLKKLSSFLGKDGAVKTARESLYFISIGANNFLLNYFTVPARSTSQYTIAEYEDFLIGIARNFLIELYSLGAKNIVLVGLPPSGCLPLVKTLNLVPRRPSLEEMKKASKDFNVKLQNLVATLSIELDGIELVYADIYNPLLKIIQNPNLYGN
ncbi:GDSL esterase/lipase At2g04570-like [Papaver somniferum]|uniref:GDSL esterase/lipase At2g04570-like n=1 Tax=Papaver somniferum TaxID=3469 RepID=UPI000E6FDB6A|nr:GDSL esterase/lipase At2g04570-like [Papaver somniferum]